MANIKEDSNEEPTPPFKPEYAFPYVKRKIGIYGSLTRWIFTAQTQFIPPFFIYTCAGHGINSNALYYLLNKDHLAVFIEVSWGNAYSSNGFIDFEKIQQLYYLVEQLASQGKLEGKKIILGIADCYSGYQRGWCISPLIPEGKQIQLTKENANKTWNNGNMNNLLDFLNQVLEGKQTINDFTAEFLNFIDLPEEQQAVAILNIQAQQNPKEKPHKPKCIIC